MVTDLFRNIKVACIIVILIFFSRANAQNTTFCDLKFINHLLRTGYFEEALFLLDSSDCSSFQINDSVNYLRGWSYFSLNMPVSSSENLLKIKPTSSLYPKSHFYAAFNYAQTGNFIKAIEVLEKIEVSTFNQISLKNFEIAGMQLLRGDLTAFDEWSDKNAGNQPEINESAINIMKVYSEIKSHKGKSPFLAGLLSGIIPGSGKLYAGKKGEAIATFISTAGIGLVTWENYRKRGIKNFNTIAFGTIFAISYMANIYGSAFSVTVIENEYKENVKSTVLFNLHIPVDTFFSKWDLCF